MTNASKSIPDDIYEGLLHATLVALIKHGYSNLTVRDIDEEWDRSRQLINYYFDGKDDLLTTVLLDVLTFAEDEIESPETDDPQQRLIETIEIGLLGPQEKHDEFWYFLTAIYEIQGQAHHHPEYQSLLNKVTVDYIDEIAAIIEAGIKQGTFNAVDSREYARAIDDLITGAHSKKIYLGRSDAPQQTLAYIRSHIIDELIR